MEKIPFLSFPNNLSIVLWVLVSACSNQGQMVEINSIDHTYIDNLYVSKTIIELDKRGDSLRKTVFESIIDKEKKDTLTTTQYTYNYEYLGGTLRRITLTVDKHKEPLSEWVYSRKGDTTISHQKHSNLVRKMYLDTILHLTYDKKFENLEEAPPCSIVLLSKWYKDKFVCRKDYLDSTNRTYIVGTPKTVSDSTKIQQNYTLNYLGDTVETDSVFMDYKQNLIYEVRHSGGEIRTQYFYDEKLRIHKIERTIKNKKRISITYGYDKANRIKVRVLRIHFTPSPFSISENIFHLQPEEYEPEHAKNLFRHIQFNHPEYFISALSDHDSVVTEIIYGRTAISKHFIVKHDTIYTQKIIF